MCTLTFGHSGAQGERRSARMPEIKSVGLTWMAKCIQLTSLPFKGLAKQRCHSE